MRTKNLMRALAGCLAATLVSLAHAQPASAAQAWPSKPIRLVVGYTKGDVAELRKAYAGFHEEVRMVLDACPDRHKWAILEREPLPAWSKGRVALLADACHPMTPYMAQGDTKEDSSWLYGYDAWNTPLPDPTDPIKAAA